MPILKLKPVAAIAALLLPALAQAHSMWFIPSKTVLSVGQWVTVDAGAATQPFIKDHNAIALDSLVITAPDGSVVAPESAATGKLRSVFDLQLQQPGTYKIAIVNQNIMASWTEDGKPKRWPARGTPYSAEAFAREVPAKAKDLKVTQMLRRLETYVTAGKPTEGALKPEGKGLELVPITAFNDLYAEEEATFKLLLDGKPASGIELELIADGAQYRDSVDAVQIKTDAEGLIRVTWPRPGLYYLSASLSDDRAEKPAKERRMSYAGVFEVLAP